MASGYVTGWSLVSGAGVNYSATNTLEDRKSVV